MNERQLLTKKPCNVTTNSIPWRNSDSGKASVSLLSSTTTTTTPTPTPPPSPTASAFGCLAPPADAPATVLSLSSRSGCEFHYIESSDRIISSHPQFKSQSNGGSGSPSLVYSIPSFCKKRASENDDNSGDCRHKRMIKNRESAARSRSRKQAYTNGLENEVNRLTEENAELRRQLEKIFINVPWYFSMLYSMFSPFLTQRTKSKFVISKEGNVVQTLYKKLINPEMQVFSAIPPEGISPEQLQLCCAPDQHPRKKSLQRSLTAPF